MHRDHRAEFVPSNGDGLQYEKRKELPIRGAESCSVADLNKDGYLEMVFANKQAERKNGIFIYWGSNEGFSKE